ncbi:hypothetical protein UlMin_024053 [Ulmus minor]
MLVLGEFDITVVAPRAKKSQALADLLVVFPSQGEEIIERPIPGGIAEISIIEANEWELTFDGASTSEGGGVGIVLTNPEGQVTVKAHKLMFGCSNNEAEYEALISGLNLALEAGAKGLIIKGDSKLVIQQVRGEFAVKEPALARYRTIVQQLLENFPQHRLEHVPRTQNRHADALATMASKVEIKKSKPFEFSIAARDRTTLGKHDQIDKWMVEIKEKLEKGKTSDYKITRHFHLLEGILYYKAPTGVLSRCLDSKEALSKLQEIHADSCGQEGTSLVHRIQ